MLLAALLSSSPAAAQRANQGEDDSSALVAEGRAALRAGSLDDAAKALDQAITLNPRRVEAYVLRAGVYAARKQYAAGIELLRRAQVLAPSDVDVLTALGSQLVLSGQADTGIPLLKQAVAGDAARYDAQLLLGHDAHDAGRWPDAITALEAYFAHRPPALAHEDARYQIDLADAYLRFHAPTKALELFARAAHDRPNDLRAKIGVAWATAATDCRRARPLLHDLAPIAEQHPEVYLVDGRCALALGDSAASLALGRRFVERNNTAAGHALVGESLAARGNLADARKELAIAHELEPTRRRWSVRLAYVLRRASSPRAALEELERIGPPTSPGLDPDWWTELGESLLADGEPADAATRLAPAAAELTTSAPLHTVLGAAQLATGQTAPAIASLEIAEANGSTPRSRKLLGTALAAAGATRLAAGDAAGAEPTLSRAAALDGNPTVWRDLALARLALGTADDAFSLLDRAAKADGLPITQMLAARARATTGDVAAARPLYERALTAARGTDAIEISLDWAASELEAGGDVAVGVAALERTAAIAKGGPFAARHRTALATARHAAAIAALRAGAGARSLDLMRGVLAVDNSPMARCDFAVAAVAGGDRDTALAALRSIAGLTCPFPPPADVQAAPILTAFSDGLNPRRAGAALTKLTALGGSSTGVAAVLRETAVRVVALDAAQDAYHANQIAAARAYLVTARSANARIGGDEVALDLAILDLVDGTAPPFGGAAGRGQAPPGGARAVEPAIGQLERLSGKLPEALIALGIAYDLHHEPQKALDAWRRAKKLGSRFAPLTEWIESKERIYGAAPAAGGTP